MDHNLLKPLASDIIHDNEPDPPWFVKWGEVLAWSITIIPLLAAVLFVSSSTYYIMLLLLGFTCNYLIYRKWVRAQRGWYAKFRWYRATIDKVIVASKPEFYVTREGALPKHGTITLRMSNRHELEFHEPVDHLLAAPAVLYRAFYVAGEFHHMYEQPSP